MSGIVGRVLRERRERTQRLVITKPPPPEESVEPSKVDESFNLRDGCFVPCLKGPWLCNGLGLFLILLGSLMCYFAFHSDSYTRLTPPLGNPTTTLTMKVQGGGYLNDALWSFLKSLAYIGPTVIGIGAFIIIVSCVMIFDRRELILSVLKSREMQMNKKSKDSVYNAVVARYIRKQRLAASADSEQDKTAGPNNYKHIASALVQICHGDTVNQRASFTAADKRSETATQPSAMQGGHPPPKPSCQENEPAIVFYEIASAAVKSHQGADDSGDLPVPIRRPHPPIEIESVVNEGLLRKEHHNASYEADAVVANGSACRLTAIELSFGASPPARMSQ